MISLVRHTCVDLLLCYSLCYVITEFKNRSQRMFILAFYVTSLQGQNFGRRKQHNKESPLGT